MKNSIINRKEFLTLSGAFIGTAFLSPFLSQAQGKKIDRKTVKFAVTSDVHQDIMHDASDRLNVFFDAARKNKVDFIIELGDFCQAKDENIPFKELWHSYEGEKYNVIGNHDMDAGTKKDYMKFMRMPSRYYSFDKGGVHFIVLDANIVVRDGEYLSADKGRGYGRYIDSEQVEWLKKEVVSTQNRIVIFSHQGLENTVDNGYEIHKIFEEENKRVGFLKVMAALSGHRHTSYLKQINGISYIQINSASNKWVGDKYIHAGRYSKEINDKHPYLKYTLPYKDALYSIVTISKKEIEIKGVKSEFVAPTPEDLNVPLSLKDPLPVPWNDDFTIDIRQ